MRLLDRLRCHSLTASPMQLNQCMALCGMNLDEMPLGCLEQCRWLCPFSSGKAAARLLLLARLTHLANHDRLLTSVIQKYAMLGADFTDVGHSDLPRRVIYLEDAVVYLKGCGSRVRWSYRCSQCGAGHYVLDAMFRAIEFIANHFSLSDRHVGSPAFLKGSFVIVGAYKMSDLISDGWRGESVRRDRKCYR